VHIAPAPRDAHADISQQLAELLGAPARAGGLVPTIAQFNIGSPNDYRVPDGGLHPHLGHLRAQRRPDSRDRRPAETNRRRSVGRVLERPPTNRGAVALRAREAACGPFRETVRNWIDQGSLPAIRVGARRVRIRRTDLDAFLMEASGPDATNGAQPAPEAEAQSASDGRTELGQALDCARAALDGGGNHELAEALRDLADTASRLARAVEQRPD
jgi:excisionase family DNA binding protein